MLSIVPRIIDWKYFCMGAFETVAYHKGVEGAWNYKRCFVKKTLLEVMLYMIVIYHQTLLENFGNFAYCKCSKEQHIMIVPE